MDIHIEILFLCILAGSELFMSDQNILDFWMPVQVMKWRREYKASSLYSHLYFNTQIRSIENFYGKYIYAGGHHVYCMYVKKDSDKY